MDIENDLPRAATTRTNKAQRPVDPGAPPVVPSRQARSSGDREEAGRSDSGLVLDRSGRPVSRSRKNSDDKYHIDPAKIPQGWSYEWKRFSTFGQEDRSYMQSLADNGWEAVPCDRHPEMMGNGYSGPIVRDGMILMERPAQLTREARIEDNEIAREMIRVKERQLRDTPDGTMTRDDPRVRPRINRSYEPADIPE
jgi:hypothetical protein